MSASSRYSVTVSGISALFDAAKSIMQSEEQIKKLEEQIQDIEKSIIQDGIEKEAWEEQIEIMENAPIKISRSKDSKEICVEPVDENNEKAVASVKKVKQAYSRLKVINQLKNKGYDKVKEQKMPDGSIRLVVQKWQ